MGKATAIAGAVIPSITVIFYILSLFPLYVSRFDPVEAAELASFDRYCGIVFLTGLLYGIWLLRDAICNMSNKVVMLITSVLLVASVFHSRADIVKAYTGRETVNLSIEYRSLINILSGKINKNTPEDASILMVANDKEDAAYYPVIQTISKPRNITYSTVHFSAEVNADGLSVEDLEDILASTYDYVAIYHLTDNVKETYSGIFEDESKIRSLSLYQVDKKSGKLTLVE